MKLSSEEQFLWHLARTWRAPTPPAGATAEAPALNWTHLVATAVDNRMQTLLDEHLRATGLHRHLPPAGAQPLQTEVDEYHKRARLFSQALRLFLDLAGQRGLEVVVLKGLWVAEKIYGNAALRPGGDIDLLLREEDVPRALALLEYDMGYGRWWQPLLDDAYYARHHLHQQRCNVGRAIWFEPHWRLDHPYTRLTIDYEAMMDRARPGQLLGQPVQELAWPDLLLSLCVHLVKHAVYLPATLARPDLPRLLLADGMLMYFVDVAEVLKLHGDAIDWQQTVRLAEASGAVTILGSVLRVCADYLDAPVPAAALDALPVTRPVPVTRRLMHRLADVTIAAYRGETAHPLWRFLTGYQETLIFRPIRLLDLWHYLLPGRGYLRRRYGNATTTTALRHLLRAIAHTLRAGADSLYFTWQNRRRLRSLNPDEERLADMRF